MNRAEVRSAAGAVSAADRQRSPYAERQKVQAARLRLPLLPTTTIGSFPQTAQIRTARAAWRRGELDHSGYEQAMRQEIARVVELQEEIGLDVLVHGEAERNDMVQYFAELLDGFVTTEHGWVQSYGSRCTRPSILWGDVSRPAPMTVAWSSYAQSLTDKPLKGMLTGPVTIMAWSFVRDDVPRALVADQLGLALREEVADLEAAGIPVIQVDEPAIRETLPLRRAERADYLKWSVGAFRLATGGAGAATQIHTHLCYSEFDVVIDAVDHLDADVTSIEASRSRMDILPAVAEHGFERQLGPGVWDIHSPRVPSVDECEELLERAVAAAGRTGTGGAIESSAGGRTCRGWIRQCVQRTPTSARICSNGSPCQASRHSQRTTRMPEARSTAISRRRSSWMTSSIGRPAIWRPYLTLPSNSPMTPRSGQMKSTRPTSRPRRSQISSWRRGSGRWCSIMTARLRLSPGDSERGSATSIHRRSRVLPEVCG